ncbi:MAG: cyclase family protein [Polaromonas sp.]|uniref:cyclase family protein n=1 Tax=Polaromonas sp. TaxID=1869339 RepID=UPI002487513F|nr:cyclase family protein [Polaromonas sp.]MDI1269218.1 cyclase family protein [Polaromonas sp.]
MAIPKALQEPRWKQRPPGSNWGDFGPDDQYGRMNLLTHEKVKQGIAEVREGRTFCLSLPLDYPGGNAMNEKRHAPILRPTLRNGRPNMNYRLFTEQIGRTDVICDDLAIIYLQYSTQWDSLAHIGQLFDSDGDGIPEPLFYNGYRAEIDVQGPADAEGAGLPGPPHRLTATSSAKALGIEKMAECCVQGRAVMVDLSANLGAGRTLVGYDALMRVLDQDQVVVEPGDMVCLHTGFAQRILDMQRKPDMKALSKSGAVLDGRDEKLLRWITDSGLSALIADNEAVESQSTLFSHDCCAALPLHEHCLFKLGVHLGELWHLTPLANWLRENGRSRFLLTAPPLRLPGAVGSPTTPIATV